MDKSAPLENDLEQKVAATFAFLQNLRTKILNSQAGSPKGLAAQPQLQHLLAIPANRRVATHPKQSRVHVRRSVIQRKATGREQAIVKQGRPRPVTANDKHR